MASGIARSVIHNPSRRAFDSIAHASRVTGVSKASIYSSCNETYPKGRRDFSYASIDEEVECPEESMLVVGFPSYEVTRDGKVWSRKNGKFLKQNLSKRWGYYTVGLYLDGKVHHMRTNRVVAQAWLPNPDNLPIVNHKNCVRTDNRVENLEWASHKYNAHYGNAIEKRLETINKTPGLKKSIHEKTGKAKRKKVFDLTDGSVYDSCRFAADALGVSVSTISLACRGKIKMGNGHILSYKEVS